MGEAVILRVNLIPPTVGKRAVGGCQLHLCGRVLGVNPLRPVRIYQIGAHVSIAGIHDEAFSMGSVLRIWAGAPPVSTSHSACPILLECSLAVEMWIGNG
jgi:hypothetical protein